MQGLQHETVAAQRHDDVRVGRAGIVVTLAHGLQRIGGIGRRGEMQGRHGARVSPRSATWDAPGAGCGGTAVDHEIMAARV